MRAFLVVLGLALVAGPAKPALAKRVPAKPSPANPAPVGLTETFRFAPAAGFVDDPIGTDGTRVAFVVADTAGTAELHVVGLDGVEVAPPIDLAPVTLKPIALAFVGDRVLVIGGETDAQMAALIDLDGMDAKGKPLKSRIVYRTPTANRITALDRAGKRVLALYTAEPIKTGIRHTIELRAAETGKRVGKVKTLDVDGSGANAKLDFRTNHWIAGGTRVVGVKGGTWNKQEDQRSPDVEATYDLVAGKFVSTAAIPDPIAQRKRFNVLAAAGGVDAFARLKEDLSELELWRDGDKTVITLDQPLIYYGDPRRSLDYAPGPNGPWIALQIDPVNVEAVKKQKADVEYWDLYEVDAGKATRRARLPAGGQRLRFGWAGDRLWVVERNVGFDRGGKSLAFYSVP
jgi:hypothetical protein